MVGGRPTPRLVQEVKLPGCDPASVWRRLDCVLQPTKAIDMDSYRLQQTSTSKLGLEKGTHELEPTRAKASLRPRA